MKIAICLSGLVGNIVGKSNDSNIGVNEVLKLSYRHWNKQIIQTNGEIDFFVHSWDIDVQQAIKRYFSPKLSSFEKQIIFDVPAHIIGDENRKQSHYSRWYSTMKSVELKAEYEIANNFKYDCVMISRFDIAWKKPIIFADHDMSHVYCGGWWNQSDVSIKDFWFFSSSANMDRFGELYSHIGHYMLTSNKRLNKKISSHKLAKYHIDKLGLKTKYLLKCDDNIDPTKSDYPLIRYEYFKAAE